MEDKNLREEVRKGQRVERKEEASPKREEAMG
jgi:hypothetical protein